MTAGQRHTMFGHMRGGVAVPVLRDQSRPPEDCHHLFVVLMGG